MSFWILTLRDHTPPPRLQQHTSGRRGGAGRGGAGHRPPRALGGAGAPPHGGLPAAQPRAAPARPAPPSAPPGPEGDAGQTAGSGPAPGRVAAAAAVAGEGDRRDGWSALGEWDGTA